MDNFLTELSDQEREAVGKAMEILSEGGLTATLTKMYQSEAELAIMISKTPPPAPHKERSGCFATPPQLRGEGSE